MDSPQPIEGLARDAQAGDRSAFERLLDHFRPGLESWVRIRAGERLKMAAEVDDLVQESLLRALCSFERFEWRGEKAFANWLCRIAENAIHESVHRARRDDAVAVEGDVTAWRTTRSPRAALNRESAPVAGQPGAQGSAATVERLPAHGRALPRSAGGRATRGEG